jgi:soluble lytic murein transglycosylase-like protein
MLDVVTKRITGEFGDHVKAASTKYEVPQFVIASVIQAESSGNPAALSPSGAIGLMQVMPAMVKAYLRANAPHVTVDQFKADPRLQILAGTWVITIKQYHIRTQAKINGYNPVRAVDYTCVLAAYFGGFNYATGRINWAFFDGAGTPCRVALERYTRHFLKYREYFNE